MFAKIIIIPSMLGTDVNQGCISTYLLSLLVMRKIGLDWRGTGANRARGLGCWLLAPCDPFDSIDRSIVARSFHDLLNSRMWLGLGAHPRTRGVEHRAKAHHADPGPWTPGGWRTTINIKMHQPASQNGAGGVWSLLSRCGSPLQSRDPAGQEAGLWLVSFSHHPVDLLTLGWWLSTRGFEHRFYSPH